MEPEKPQAVQDDGKRCIGGVLFLGGRFEKMVGVEIGRSVSGLYDGSGRGLGGDVCGRCVSARPFRPIHRLATEAGAGDIPPTNDPAATN